VENYGVTLQCSSAPFFYVGEKEGCCGTAAEERRTLLLAGRYRSFFAHASLVRDNSADRGGASSRVDGLKGKKCGDPANLL
jgi:hypothetical protein